MGAYAFRYCSVPTASATLSDVPSPSTDAPRLNIIPEAPFERTLVWRTRASTRTRQNALAFLWSASSCAHVPPELRKTGLNASKNEPLRSKLLRPNHLPDGS